MVVSTASTLTSNDDTPLAQASLAHEHIPHHGATNHGAPAMVVWSALLGWLHALEVAEPFPEDPLHYRVAHWHPVTAFLRSAARARDSCPCPILLRAFPTPPALSGLDGVTIRAEDLVPVFVAFDRVDYSPQEFIPLAVEGSTLFGAIVVDMVNMQGTLVCKPAMDTRITEESPNALAQDE